MSQRFHLSPEQKASDEVGAQMQQVEESGQGEKAIPSSSIKYHSPTVAPVYPDVPAETLEKTDDTILTYEQEDWPHQEECTALISPEFFPSVFLPPENKGFE